MMTIEQLKKEYSLLNDDQIKIILDNNPQTIVPAGAGSGKTHTLVIKVVELIKKEKSLDPFLVLTFTNKASFEMKDRIKKLISKTKEISHLTNQVDSANIQTFDGFALNFVKQHASLINIDSNLDILDNVVADSIKFELMQETVMEAILFDRYNETHKYMLYNLTDKRDENQLVKDLINLYSVLYKEFGTIEVDIKNTIMPLGISKDWFNNLIDEFPEEFLNNNQEYLSELNNYLLNLNDPNFISYDFPKLKNRTFKGVTDESIKKSIISKLKSIHESYKYQVTNQTFIELKDILNGYADGVIEILKQYELKLKKFKADSNKYEFDDITRLLIKILKDKPFVLKRIQKQFKYIFVDEFQDTSSSQSSFLNLLIQNNDRSRVLYVGDIKQSIYQFRDAIPKNFINKQNEKGVKSIPLNINYRSSKPIIDFVNSLFVNILDNEFKYDINYSKGHQMLSGSNKYISNNDANVYLIELYKEDKQKKLNYVLEEVFTIGKNIKDLMLKDSKLNYRDFAILNRNRSSFHIYKEVFEYLEIPLQVQVPITLNKSHFLKLIANLMMLSLHINSEDKEVFTEMKFNYFSVAKSELFNLSHFSLFKQLTNDKFDIEFNPLIKEKLKELNQIINNNTNSEIIDYIIVMFEIYDKILSTYNLDEKHIEIDYLYELADSLTDLNKIGPEFVKYIYELAYDDKKIDVSILQPVNENSVKITNIHQSKGLEYEILFVGQLNNKLKTHHRSTVKFNSLTGLTFSKRFDTFASANTLSSGYDLLLKIKREEEYQLELKEELRLLYTAFTRAKKSLYIITNPEDEYYNLNSFTDYLHQKGLIKSLIPKENIVIYNQKQSDDMYFKKINEKAYYYNDLIDKLPSPSFKIESKPIVYDKASGGQNKVLDDQTKLIMDKGTELHEIFEYSDFRLLHLSNNKLQKQLGNTKFGDYYLRNAKDYFHEFSFISKSDEISGIIDLLVFYDKEIHIVDYKTKNIHSETYDLQLKSYKNYIKNIYPKTKVKAYLYSIVTGETLEVV